MTASNVAAANMQKSPNRCTGKGFLLFIGGVAMPTQKDSPNSAEIVAQAKAGREGFELNFRFRLSIASAVVVLLISAALELFG